MADGEFTPDEKRRLVSSKEALEALEELRIAIINKRSKN